jgi:UDP-glucose 4-epimerase
MRILVTGGMGFIGSHLVEGYLNREDVEHVYILDNLSTGNLTNISTIDADQRKLTFVEGSIQDLDLLTLLCKKVDVVEHLAANLEVCKGIQDIQNEAHMNINGTLNVVIAAMKSNIKKLHFSSSGGVYGRQKKDCTELTIPEPHWPYGVSKLAAEQYIMQQGRLYGLPVTCFRYAIVYGPREWYGRVLTIFLKRMLNGLRPVVFGDGKQVRDFVYVEDVVDAHLKALDCKNSRGEVFNVGSGIGRSLNDIVHIISDMSKSKIDPIYDNVGEGSTSSYQPDRVRLEGELEYFVLNCDKAKSILNWEPTMQFSKGLHTEIEWYLRNRNQWEIVPRV